MKIRRHLFQLREAYPHVEDGVPIEVTTAELAEKLDCTHRNMVLLLKRMTEEGWVGWTAKRGRGNRSLLTFERPLDKLLLEEAEELAMRGDLQSAFELLQNKGAGSAALGRFQQWLSGQFGFRSTLDGQRRTDSLRFPLPGAIGSLDPARIHFIGESHLVSQLFDGLVRVDARGEIVLPHLAHAWETNEDRTEWTFYLRKGVMFHHGREMTSADVRFTLERLQRLAPGGLYNWVYHGIEDMLTPDSTTIRIRLKQRNEVFLSFLSTNRASIVPEDVCSSEGESFGEADGSVIGTGPFRLASRGHGIWMLEAFPAYFQGRAFLDRVEVWTIPLEEEAEKDRQQQELRQFQVMHNVRIEGLTGGQFQQVRQSGTTCKFITVNELKPGPLRNPAIRAALDRAIHRGELLRQLSGDVIEGASSFWTTEKNGGPSDSRGISYEDECVAIKQELRDAGYLGETLTLTTIPQYGHDASIIQGLLEKAGVSVSVSLLPAEQFKGAERMSADLLLFAVMLDEHREIRLIDLYKSMMQHAEPQVRAKVADTLERILAEPDASARTRLFIGIEGLLSLRHSLLFLYRKHLKTAFHPSVQGISLESLGWVRFRDLWFR
ncbi:ABC transporter substrate-binding protein [Paenibacillus soyae]|uniref:ABC transporter substrate-binding protein n=1 Tax=Paenibacillus soyae TaxID=2969249 RepID=A0A9X2MPT1_9BACL|nr:ABC transporter substrate-binding protein [Paenibacillus soyae]MCR2803581.1 ABC transporter substrate-binding protein [Paenibacillus soyae]